MRWGNTSGGMSAAVAGHDAGERKRALRYRDAALTLAVLTLVLGAELLWLAGLFVFVRDPT
jgi:hypothetical protein